MKRPLSSSAPSSSRPWTLLAAGVVLLSMAACDAPGRGGSGGVVGDPCIYNPALPQCQGADGGSAGDDAATQGDTSPTADTATQGDTSPTSDAATQEDTSPTGDAAPQEDSTAGSDTGPDDGASCTPACAGKQCGDDGCGGSCGTCAGGETCDTATGQCVTQQADCGAITELGCCTAAGTLKYCSQQVLKELDCAGTDPQCGWDGAGGWYDCGTDGAASPDASQPLLCPGEACVDTCGTRECGFVCGKACGPHGGGCPVGESCSTGGTCEGCTPQCAGKTCGDDGCGGSCGSCGTDAVCLTGACVVDPCAAGGAGEVGCCLGPGLTYCNADGTPFIGDCGSSCGWDATSGYYSCGATGADPSGAAPLECQPAP